MKRINANNLLYQPCSADQQFLHHPLLEEVGLVAPSFQGSDLGVEIAVEWVFDGKEFDEVAPA